MARKQPMYILPAGKVKKDQAIPGQGRVEKLHNSCRVVHCHLKRPHNQMRLLRPLGARPHLQLPVSHQQLSRVRHPVKPCRQARRCSSSVPQVRSILQRTPSQTVFLSSGLGGLASDLGWALERVSLGCMPGHLRSSPGTNMSARANKVVHV